MARNPSEMAGMLGGIGRLKELRQRLFVVVLVLMIFRFGTFIPVPGINPIALIDLMDMSSGTIVDMFNMFSGGALDRKSTRLNSSHVAISYAVFCLKKKTRTRWKWWSSRCMW